VERKYSIAKIEAYFQNKYPLYCKPVSGAGGLGTFKINEKKELEEKLNFLFNDMFKKQTSQKILIQEFVDGEFFIVNFISINGEHFFTDA
jgi:predicted ATP-grasp superfamily ATP-dependent carboligase